MQSATTVLGVIRDHGRRGLPLERLYRQLFNRQLYLVAYGRIYSNKGSMTPGVTGETVDGMSLARIDAIIRALRAQSYRWKPARRTYIAKKNSAKKRPLSMPTWSDKLLAEVVRMILDAYYDVQFADSSHGFRPGRGCHTALVRVQRHGIGSRWFIEGDISDCFGSLDHQVMIRIIGESVHDGRFLELIRRMLQAGYLEDWQWHATYSGAPQGGIASPVLSNIYLDRLDRFVEQHLIPQYTRGITGAKIWSMNASRPARRTRSSTATSRRPARSRARSARSRARTRTTPGSDACHTPGTPMTSCSGSPDPSAKPRRSRRRSAGSCATNSRWSCPSRKP